MSQLLLIPAFIAGFLLLLILTGLLISYYWKWFIIPIFNVKAIDIPQSLGLSLFVSLFTSNARASEMSEKSNYDSLFKLILYYAFYALIGYALHFFVKNKYNK
jgi:hypothetical protein